ncbi:phage tail sheath family protein [Herbaspirillum seropedicae]|uniref:phage tail sheath family protein n=1 Tax=Herbaspirillum seropedicae TaxID=964 RepID=UPI00112003D3|nr:phage tail sheath C-terminal domain-containing protein [Herbaspirillum seropedicae]QDD64823.1 phage tail sheath family protein [Herbaspirillum seropedicae]
MAQYKTPGVYVVEKNAFPNSVVEVATAVPAFIGYTEYASNKGTPLANKAWRISSMAEFHAYFGGAPRSSFTLKAQDAPTDAADFSVTAKDTNKRVDYLIERDDKAYLLYYSMLFFFQNGGGPCYIVSVGTYADGDIDAGKIKGGIEVLLKEQEPTMVVTPDAVSLSSADCQDVQQAALMHCGVKMRNRIALLDVYNGFRDRQDPAGDCITDFREAVGTNSLDFAVAYYPWVNTSIVKEKDISFTAISNLDVLKGLITDELASVLDAKAANAAAQAKIDQLKKSLDQISLDYIKSEKDPDVATLTVNKTLLSISTLYPRIITAIQKKLNLLPPSAGMAGLYTMVDNTRGVWKAPANVSLSGVISPTVSISNEEQEDLNVTTVGKSINAIRSFIGEGVLVWGARTLDGNSLDWRYVSVRRTMIMIEESIKQACKAYVFEPNTANTWVTIKSMIRNFLTSVWKRGGLAGASPDDAFSVFVGLGETMTADDILEGLMKVSVLVAVSRPAEFIEITFQQQMQKS